MSKAKKNAADKSNVVSMDKFMELPIEKMALAAWNYKENDDELMLKLQNNLKLNGQVENIIVRELDTGFYEVVNGNHRLMAMQKIGASSVVVYNLGKVSREEAIRVAIETNETKFQTDHFKMATLISEMKQKFSEEDLAGTLPFSLSQMKNFEDIIGFDWNTFGEPEDPTERKNDEETEGEVENDEMIHKIVCPKCGHEYTFAPKDK